MLEKTMEDLIASHPQEFFPRHEFVLKGRQQSFQGVGRFDLLFEDRYGMAILMELKAVPARYETVDQIARYKEALRSRGTTNLIMWIVAPVIPAPLREMLTHLGIEYSEIHELEFQRVAERVGFQFQKSDAESSAVLSVIEKPVVPAPVRKSDVDRSQIRAVDAWGFGEGTQNSFLINALERGGQTKEEIRKNYVAIFHPSEGKPKSGFNVFFSDSKRPIGTYAASRSLIILQNDEGHLSLDAERAKQVKDAIAGGILSELSGLHFKRDQSAFNVLLSRFGLPSEN